MKALILNEGQRAPVLLDAPDPVPAAGEALVRLEAAALNHRDVYITQGKYPGIVHPAILGSDGCGVVEAVTDGDAAWVGRRVVINPSLSWGPNPEVQGPDFSILGMPSHGTLAERIAIPVANLQPAPDHLTSQEAAALPLAGLTAWRALMTRAGLRSGERVLVTGIGGGVALFALQFAVASGAEVWVTSSDPGKIERARALGAQGGALYADEGWSKQLQQMAPAGFDVIIDSAGGAGFGALVRLLAMGGRLAFYGGTRGKWPEILPQHLFFKQVSILASTMGSPSDFEAMVRFVAQHEIRPVVDGIYDLSQAAEGFARLSEGAQFGKVVFTV